MAAVVTDGNFEAEVLKSDVPVLVDFWATWCQPCKAIAPILEELSGTYQGKAKIVKLNADENPRTASQYNVRSLPTLLVFKGGKVVDTQIGAVPKPKIEALLQRAL